MANAAYDPSTDVGMVRLLLNDNTDPFLFSDDEINAVLALEGGVKRAAAQLIDTNADNEALASKVLKSQDVQTDGAKVADALRKRAAVLRAQADAADDDTGFYFDVIDLEGGCRPELTGLQWPLP